jgi:hypothetical protein
MTWLAIVFTKRTTNISIFSKLYERLNINVRPQIYNYLIDLQK